MNVEILKLFPINQHIICEKKSMQINHVLSISILLISVHVDVPAKTLCQKTGITVKNITTYSADAFPHETTTYRWHHQVNNVLTHPCHP